MKNILTLLLLISINHVFAQSTSSGTASQTIKDPVASVAGSSGGKIAATIFKAAKKIDVTGPDTSAVVTSFTIYFQGKGFETAPGMLENIKGNLFTKDVIRLLERSAPGTTVTIDEIKVWYNNVNKKVPSLIFILY
ncbi:GldM family protein [Lacibacter sp. H375]|uniref:GldM family protein n=1 Tax=Lacibacter sp. H375 TaxID=3133424 RepID=UPI0030C1C67B